MNKSNWTMGLQRTEGAFLLLIPQPGFNSWRSRIFFDISEFYQLHWLEESGLRLENVDRTHLVLASGNWQACTTNKFNWTKMRRFFCISWNCRRCKTWFSFRRQNGSRQLQVAPRLPAAGRGSQGPGRSSVAERPEPLLRRAASWQRRLLCGETFFVPCCVFGILWFWTNDRFHSHTFAVATGNCSLICICSSICILINIDLYIRLHTHIH